MGSAIANGACGKDRMPDRLSIKFARFGFQKCNQFVFGLKRSPSQVRRQDGFNNIEHFARVGAHINLRGYQITIRQPEQALSNILRSLKHDHCTCLA